MKKLPYLATTLVIATLLVSTSSAGALVVTDLDTGATMSNLNWIIVNDASVTTYGANNDNYNIKVGTANWGANEWDLQPRVWHSRERCCPEI